MTRLPVKLTNWFAANGWVPHAHQVDMLQAADHPASLLIAPTGGGKTLAGFLPTLADLCVDDRAGMHTLYISPLKALAADIKRNLRRPVADMGLDIRIEDRTGDTTATQKKRQRADPPHILLTTPESLALLTSYDDAPRMFAGVKRVIVDEIHALLDSKRGDQLMLALARIQRINPDLCRTGLSATVDDPDAVAQFLTYGDTGCTTIFADPGPAPDITMLQTDAPPPWAGGGAAYAIPAVIDQIKQHKITLIFHNTRAQAELFFHNLWLANDDALPIAIHHGALDKDQRSKVEAAMIAGQLRAVVCTGTLDLGIDWGDVDLVIQIGAPKNVKRLVQRIGRANHTYKAPSKAILVPANRFEVVECVAALDAARENDLDGDPRGAGPRDVLCQHILIAACAGPFDADDLFAEFCAVGPYRGLTRAEFDGCLDYIATGGYALRVYDTYQRLILRPDGQWQLRDPRATQRIRMNLGTIQDTDTLKVKWKGRGGTPLGEIEEGFAATLTPGDTFLIGGRVVRYENIRDMTVQVTRHASRKPKVATFSGTKFSTSTQLSHRVLRMFGQDDWPDLPPHTRDWLHLQRQVSTLPRGDQMLVESFPHDGRAQTVFYGFAGRNAMQTLGLLLTKAMEDQGLGPMGFVTTDYAVLIWSLEPVDDPSTLLDRDLLRDGLDTWLAGNAVMKRTFRGCAIIAGMIDRNLPSNRKTGRQATFSSDILYDTLIKYDPDHVMLKITREEAMKGLVDFGRIEEMLDRMDGRIDHRRLDRVTPLAAPLFLEVGKVPVKGQADETILEQETRALFAQSGLADITV